MFRSLLSAVLILPAACPASATPPVDGEYTLWKDTNQSNALFLPEDVLLTTAIEELPLLDREKSDLRAQAAFYKAAMENQPRRGKSTSGCHPEVIPTPERSAAPQKTLLEIAEESDVILVGRVTHVTPGWDSWRRLVVDGVFVEVDEIVRGVDDLPVKNVALLIQGGTAEIMSGAICSGGRDGRFVPKAGDTVFVTGYVGPYDDRLILHSHIFPVYDGGVVQPQGRQDVDPRAYRVSDIQAAIEEAGR